MPRQRPSRQELNRRRRQTGFVGRHSELTDFRGNFARDPGGSAFQYLFHLYGNAGVGKTSLVRQWEAAAREHQAVTAYVDDDVHSALEAMETVSAQFGRQGCALKGFDKLLATYRQRRHEAGTAPGAQASADAAGPGQPPPASPSSTIVAQAGLVALGTLPGVGAFSGAVDPQQLAQGADRLRALLSARFRNHDDVQLVMSPLQVLTPVFLEDLAEVAEHRPWVVLFFDVFERTGPLLNEWLKDVLVGEEYGELPDNVVAVLSGQGRLDARCWGDHLYLIAEVPLEVFTEEEARQLLAAKGVTDERVIEVILHLTGRLPVLVDLLAQTHPQNPDEVGDPSGTAVERFLKWEADPHRRTAALACALPLQLNEDIYRAAVPEAAQDQYPWLRGLPFVTGQAGRCRYHDVVRTPMLRLQRTQSPTQWQDQHTRLADTFQHWRQALENTLPPDKRWNDPSWREHRLNEAYHRLCAHPHRTLPDALLEMVHACDDGIATLRRWAQTLTQAGQETDTAALTAAGQRLQDTAGDDPTSLVTALTQLLTAAELSAAGRALAYTLRGREHRNSNQYDQALNDYTTALTLDPDLARAHYGCGETYRLMGQFEEALTHLTRAIELELADSVAVTSRGQTYRAMGRYHEALTDYTRAIQINPNDAWALTSRGQTHHAMGQYDDALTDYTRAIQINPGDALTIASRGWMHRTTWQYDDALADYTRAIELDPTLAWAVAGRGKTHHAMGQYDDALADYTRAVELDPTLAYVLTDRGAVYRLTNRYEEALADLTRAIEINPAGGWSHYELAVTYRRIARTGGSEHLRRAAEIFTAEASGNGISAARARGNLFIVHCAIPEWDKAAELLECFLNGNPAAGVLREALQDLWDLQQSLAVDADRLEPLKRRLENTLAGQTA